VLHSELCKFDCGDCSAFRWSRWLTLPYRVSKEEHAVCLSFKSPANGPRTSEPEKSPTGASVVILVSKVSGTVALHYGKVTARTWSGSEVFPAPACWHFSVVLAFHNTWPRDCKDAFPEAEWQGSVERSAGGRGRVTTMAFRGAADAQMFLLMGSRVWDSTGRKAWEGRLGLCSPNPCSSLGEDCLASLSCPTWLQPTGTLLGASLGTERTDYGGERWQPPDALGGWEQHLHSYEVEPVLRAYLFLSFFFFSFSFPVVSIVLLLAGRHPHRCCQKSFWQLGFQTVKAVKFKFLLSVSSKGVCVFVSAWRDLAVLSLPGF